MIPDPQPREDSRCYVCHGPRGKVPAALTKRAKAGLTANLAVDAFCSSTCARIFHGCPLPEAVGKGVGRPAGPFMHGTETGYVNGCRDECCRNAASTARRLRAERRMAA